MYLAVFIFELQVSQAILLEKLVLSSLLRDNCGSEGGGGEGLTPCQSATKMSKLFFDVVIHYWFITHFGSKKNTLSWTATKVVAHGATFTLQSVLEREKHTTPLGQTSAEATHCASRKSTMCVLQNTDHNTK